MAKAKKKDDKPGIDVELTKIDDVIDDIMKSYQQIHTEAHTAAVQRLTKDGGIKFDAELQRYDFSGLKKKENRDKLHEYMMENFDARLKGMVAKWDGLTEPEKDRYREMVFGITRDKHRKTVDSAKENYTADIHLRSQDESYKKILTDMRKSQAGMLNSAEHIDAGLRYLGVSDELKKKIDIELLRKRPEYLQQMVIDKHLRRQHIDEKYIEDQDFYKQPEKKAD